MTPSPIEVPDDGHDEARLSALDGNASGGVGRAVPDTESGVEAIAIALYNIEHEHIPCSAWSREPKEMRAYWVKSASHAVRIIEQHGWRRLPSRAEAGPLLALCDEWLVPEVIAVAAHAEMNGKPEMGQALREGRTLARALRAVLMTPTQTPQESASPAPHADPTDSARPEARTTDTKE
jgi:hypothetical protein